MKSVTIKGEPYTQIDIKTSIYLNEEQLKVVYNGFHIAKQINGFEGSFTDYCTEYFTLGANLYLTKVAGKPEWDTRKELIDV